MRILVFYDMDIYIKQQRKTIFQHLYAFNQVPNVEVYYYNVWLAGGVHHFLLEIDFDLIVYHYTFIGARWGRNTWYRIERHIPYLAKLKGYQVCIPQDEYLHSRFMCRFFKEVGIKTVFTCAYPRDWQKLYPKELSGLDHYVTVLTGYIDETEIPKIAKYAKKHQEREYDIGYRARKNPYSLGRFAMKKWQITEEFLKFKDKVKLKMNISNDSKEVFYGDDWYKFLANCRVTLGIEGGASLHDPDGYIEEKIIEFLKKKPDASFEECEKECFEGLDGNLELFALSPRHFEACMTKTCQALVEGFYHGILEPNKHYIPIKNDWSNIEEVLEKIKDTEYCEKMAQRAFEDIVLSQKYTYREFAQQILEHTQKVYSMKAKNNSLKIRFYLQLLKIREKYAKTWDKFYHLYSYLIQLIKK